MVLGCAVCHNQRCERCPAPVTPVPAERVKRAGAATAPANIRWVDLFDGRSGRMLLGNAASSAGLGPGDSVMGPACTFIAACAFGRGTARVGRRAGERDVP